MPRIMDPVLSMVHERANPQTRYFTEINAPDVARVLRRAEDEFLAPVSQTPASSITADPAGALTMASTALQIASFTHDDASVNLNVSNPSPNDFRGLRWGIASTFGRAVLKSFTAKIYRAGTEKNNLALQIYRVRGDPAEGVPIRIPFLGVQTPSAAIKWSFIPLLHQPAIWKHNEAAYTAGVSAFVTWDLTKDHFEFGRSNAPLANLDQSGEDQAYYFVITPIGQSSNDKYFWARDYVTSRAVAGVGSFQDVWWRRVLGADPYGWHLEIDGQNGYEADAVPVCSISIENYTPTAQAIYALNLPAVPQPSSVGSVVFEAGLPTGTAATFELSTAGSGGPWTVMKHGDTVTVKQQTYHARVTMTSDTPHRLAPKIAALGVEFKIPIDLTAEAIVEPIAHEVEVPFLKASVGEGRATAVRFGLRNYRDKASDLATLYPSSKIEVDVFLGSSHPFVTRDKWLHLDRAMVNDRDPSQTAETLGILSYSKNLKRKIPKNIESINVVLTVASATTTAITFASDLPDAADGYTDKHYFIRVRQSSQAGFTAGSYTREIDGPNNDVGDLGTPPRTIHFDAADPLPGTLAAGDKVEIHSASYLAQGLRWEDADPADVWLEILNVHLLIPLERIGRGDLGRAERAGLPPTVADRSSDPEVQKQLKVTLQTKEPESADELIDQLSFIMGGVTTEIGGQIVFRQIYPLRDETGQIVVPAEPVAATFDSRNTSGLTTPTGLQQRIAQISCNYGVNTTAVGEDEPAAQTVVGIDGDAMAWLDDQAVDDLAPATIPDEIVRWCYNSADGGLYLATQLVQQIVRATSTGQRVWSWTATKSQPRLVVGDRVAVITDQYTDYDPSRKVAIRGWWAYQLALVSVQGGGTRFRGFMLGLADAVQVKAGEGELPIDEDTDRGSILSVVPEDSPDGKERTYTVTAGSAVATLHVHHRLWPAGTQGDPHDFSEDAATEDDSLFIVRPDPVDGRFRFTVLHPVRGMQRPILLVPRQGPPSFAVSGDVWKIILDPAPSGVYAKFKPTVTGATANLSILLGAAVSDWPVTYSVVEGSPDNVPLLTVTLSAPTTIDQTTHPVLGNRPLPLLSLQNWWVHWTNVAREEDWLGPASADRDPLAGGLVTVDNYRTTPVFRMVFDTNTDTIRVTVPDGRTKSWNRAALDLAGSPVLYEIGDALDDASTETDLGVDEERGPYKVEYQGGGQWVTMFGPSGKLIGQPSNPPTARVRVVKNAIGNAEDVFVVPDSSVPELLRVYFRDGESDTSPVYGLVVSAGDSTPLYVTAGTEVGPANFFKNIDGSGSPSAKLSGIALTSDQIKRVSIQIEGEDSLLRNSWIPVALSLLEKPFNQSFELVWDDALGKLRAIVVAGARCLFETIQVADNDAFTSPSTLTNTVAEGGTVTKEFALSAAQRGKTWYGRALANSHADNSGLDSDYLKASVAVPALFDVTPSVAETVAAGTLTLVVADPGGVLDPTWTTGAIVPAASTTAISFEVLRLGVRTIEAPTTKPGGGASAGTYTKAITLLDHPVTLQAFAHMIDGSTEFLGAWTFDSNKISDVVDITVANNDVTATVTVRWDSDTQIGSTSARYSTNGGGSWTDTPVGSSPLLVSQFNIGRSSTKTTVLIEAKNLIDGNYGTRSTIEVDAYVTQVGQGTVSIDSNGAWSFSADGGSNVASWKYSTSTSAFPADATVASSGTGASGRAISIVNGGTLSFGQTIFVTLVPFTGASGTGTQLSTIHLRGSYLTYTATKTAAFAPGAWIVSQNVVESTVRSVTINNADGTLWNDALGATDVTSMYMDFVIPSGCTIIAIASEQYSGSANAQNDMYCVRVDAHVGTGIRNAFATLNLGWQTLNTTSMTETTTGRSYHMFGQMYATGGVACAAGTIRMGNIYVTYTMPDPKQTL